MFADDTKFYSIINNQDDVIILQENLDRFSTWCHENLLPVNINKCNVISFTKKKYPLVFNYKINNIIINRVDSIRDLGVLFSSNLSFTSNINIVINKAFKMLGFILRNTKEFKNIQVLKTLYCSLVRSNLEFGSLIWSQNSTVQLVDNVQYKFLKSIAFRLNLPISRDSSSLVRHSICIQPCEVRRKISDLLFIYDLLNNNINCPELLSKIGIVTHNYSIRSSSLFFVPFFKKKICTDSFFPRALTLCNLICNDVDFFFMSRDCIRMKALSLFSS
jgi:hypothetical protein